MPRSLFIKQRLNLSEPECYFEESSVMAILSGRPSAVEVVGVFVGVGDGVGVFVAGVDGAGGIGAVVDVSVGITVVSGYGSMSIPHSAPALAMLVRSPFCASAVVFLSVFKRLRRLTFWSQGIR